VGPEKVTTGVVLKQLGRREKKKGTLKPRAMAELAEKRDGWKKKRKKTGTRGRGVEKEEETLIGFSENSPHLRKKTGKNQGESSAGHEKWGDRGYYSKKEKVRSSANL